MLRKQNNQLIDVFRVLQLETAKLHAMQTGDAQKVAVVPKLSSDAQHKPEMPVQVVNEPAKNKQANRGSCLPCRSRKNKHVVQTVSPVDRQVVSSPDSIKAQAGLVSEAARKLTDIQNKSQFEPVLEKEYEDAKSELHEYLTNYDAMLAAAKEQLAAEHELLLQAEERIETERLHYYANLQPVVLMGVLRVYVRFNDFKTEFDKVIKSHQSLALEARDYIDILKNSQKRIDDLIEKLWSEKLGQSAKAVLAKVDRATLEKRPVAGETEKEWGLPLSLSAASMFSQPVKPADDKGKEAMYPAQKM
jgi:hypothetical protein